MEPCFNPALEEQAISRVHRLGQKRSVEIVRLMMEDTVEMRICTMLNKKYGTEHQAMDASVKDFEDDENKKPAAILAATPMVGCIRTDKAAVMEDEFDLLFGVDIAVKANFPVPDNAASSDVLNGFI